MQQEEDPISIDLQELTESLQYLTDPTQEQQKTQDPTQENAHISTIFKCIDRQKIPFFTQFEKQVLAKTIIQILDQKIPYQTLSQQAEQHTILGAVKLYHIYIILQAQFPNNMDSLQQSQQQQQQQQQENEQQKEQLIQLKNTLLSKFQDYFNFFLDFWFHTEDKQQGVIFFQIKQTLLEIIEELTIEQTIAFSDKEKFEIFESILDKLLSDSSLEDTKELCKLAIYMYKIGQDDRVLFNEKMILILFQRYKLIGKKQPLLKTQDGQKIHPIIYIILKGHQEHFQEKNLFQQDRNIKTSNISTFDQTQDNLEELVKSLLKRCMTADKASKLKDFVKLFIEQICDLLFNKEFLFTGSLLKTFITHLNTDFTKQSTSKRAQKGQFDKAFSLNMIKIISMKLLHSFKNHFLKLGNYSIKPAETYKKTDKKTCSFCPQQGIFLQISHYGSHKYNICETCTFTHDFSIENTLDFDQQSQDLPSFLGNYHNLPLLGLLLNYFSHLQQQPTKSLQTSLNILELQIHKNAKTHSKIKQTTKNFADFEKYNHFSSSDIKQQDSSFLDHLYQNFVINYHDLHDQFQLLISLLNAFSNDPAQSFRKKALQCYQEVATFLIENEIFTQNVDQIKTVLKNRTSDTQHQVREASSVILLDLVLKEFQIDQKNQNFEQKMTNITYELELDSMLSSIVKRTGDSITAVRKKTIETIFLHSEEFIDLLSFFPGVKLELTDLLTDRLFNEIEETQILSKQLLCEIFFGIEFVPRTAKKTNNYAQNVFQKGKFDFNLSDHVEKFSLNLLDCLSNIKQSFNLNLINDLIEYLLDKEQESQQEFAQKPAKKRGKKMQEELQNQLSESDYLLPLFEKSIQFYLQDLKSEKKTEKKYQILRIINILSTFTAQSVLKEIEKLKFIFQQTHTQKQSLQSAQKIEEEEQNEINRLTKLLIYCIQIMQRALKENNMLISQRTKNNFAPIESILLDFIYNEDKILFKAALQLLSVIVNTATGNTKQITNLFENAYKAMVIQIDEFFTQQQDFTPDFLIRSMIIVSELAIGNMPLLFSKELENQQQNSEKLYKNHLDFQSQSQSEEIALSVSSYKEDEDDEENITFKKLFSHFLTFARMRPEYFFKNFQNSREFQGICSQIKSTSVECLSELWKLDHNLIFDSQSLIEEFLENPSSDWRTIMYIYRIFEEFLQQHQENILQKKKKIDTYLSKKEQMKKKKQTKQEKYEEELKQSKQKQSMEGVIFMIQECVQNSYFLHISRKPKSLKLQIIATISKLCDLGISSFQQFGEHIFGLLSDLSEDVRDKVNQFLKEQWTKNNKTFELCFDQGIINAQKHIQLKRLINVAYDSQDEILFFNEFANTTHSKLQNIIFTKSFECRIIDLLLTTDIRDTEESYQMVKFYCSILISQKKYMIEDYRDNLLSLKYLIDQEYFGAQELLKQAKENELADYNQKEFRILSLTCLLVTAHLLLRSVRSILDIPTNMSFTEILQKITKKSKNPLKKTKNTPNLDPEEDEETQANIAELEELDYKYLQQFDDIIDHEGSGQWDMILILDNRAQQIKKKIKYLYQGRYSSNPEHILDMLYFGIKAKEEEDNEFEGENENEQDQENNQSKKTTKKAKTTKKTRQQSKNKRGKKKKVRITDDVPEDEGTSEPEVEFQEKSKKKKKQTKKNKSKNTQSTQSQSQKRVMTRSQKRRDGNNPAPKYKENDSDSDFEQ